MTVLTRAVLAAFAILVMAAAPVASSTSDDSIGQLERLVQEGKYDEAAAAARTALVRIQSTVGPEAPEFLAVLDLLLEARWRSGKADDETVAIGRQALEIKRRTLGPEDAGVGKTLHHLAVVYYFRNEFDEARQLWEQAIEIRSKALGTEHPDVAESLNGLANLVWTMGDLAEADRLFHRALAIREKAYGPEDPRVSMVRSNLFTLMSALGNYAEALELGERCVTLDEKTLGPDHPELAATLTNLADVYDKTGDRDTARGMYERAIAIWRDSLGPDHYLVGTAMNNLAEQLRRSGEHAEARVMFEKVLAIWEKSLGPDSPRVGLCLSNMALLAEAMGDLAKAKTLEERAAAVREKALGTDHVELSGSLHHLGMLRTATGDLANARPVFEKALAIRRDSLGAGHPAVAETQIGLAELLARSGETSGALELAIDSERIARDHLRLTGRSLAEEHALRYAATRARGLDLALSLAVDGPGKGQARRLLDALVRSRAVVLDEMAARNRSAISSTDPAVAKLADDLASARARLANLTVRGLGDLDPETYREFVEQARTAKERAERALGAASAEFAQEQRRARLGLDEIASQLPGSAALVSFVLYEHTTIQPTTPSGATEQPKQTTSVSPFLSYAAIVYRPDRREPDLVRIGPATGLEELIGRWKREAARGALRTSRDDKTSEAAYRKVGAELADAVWRPIAQHLQGIERLFIVPDGALNLVSFAALPVGKRRYLIERGPVLHYLSAERDLVSVETTTPSRGGLLALGGPDYDATSVFAALAGNDGPVTPASAGPDATSRSASCGDFRTLEFAPLPAAGKEAAEIAALWSETIPADELERSRVVHLSGSGATESAFKKEAVGRRVLHIATHGFFLRGECAGGATGGRGFKIVEEAAPEPLSDVRLSPLLLSGLALAGANRRHAASPGEEDGVLTAEEVAGLDLSGVEWAVLSACDTGVGEIQAGEGVFGLRRAVQVAGVRTLIMSLWPVDDEATRQWMNVLYLGRLEQQLDSAVAVRGAGLSVLRQRREAGESTHPFYWAAFVAAGDWR